MKITDVLLEFAPSSNPGGGNYLKALASAWYNDTFNTGDLHKGIKSQEDVERILERGIHCGDGKVRKYSIGYNADFDGVEIQSDDHYEYSDYDDAGNDIDSRTGQPWGPYDVVAFGGNELDESITEGEESSTEFYVYIGREGEGSWIGRISKDGGKWREEGGEGTKPHNWGTSYMSYLSPDEVMQWIRQDYRRHEVAGPFLDDAEAYDYAEQMGGLDEGVAEAMGEHEFKSANGPVSVTTEPGRTVVKRKEWDNSGSGSDSDSGTLNAPALGGTRKSDYDSGDYSDERSMDEAEQQKGADYRDPPEADYGDDYQAMVKRMKQLAGAGPLKTVYDPARRVYKNIPTAVQPKK